MTGILRALLILVAAGLLAAMPVPRPAAAQDVQRIAAIVNDEVITVYDLLSRIDMIVSTTGLPNTGETRQRLVPQVLNSLIDESLQLQEAERLNIRVTEAEMEGAVRQLEQRNGLAPGQMEAFLADSGIRRSTVIQQIRAAFAWGKVIQQRLRPRIRIGEEEVDEMLDRLRRTGGGNEYQVSEIFLTVDSPDDEEAKLLDAGRLTRQIRDGADFASLAQQFSQSSSAANGGNIGWVRPGQIDPAVEAALATLQPGQVSDPLRVLSGIYILRLDDRRARVARAAAEVTVSLRQVFLRFPNQASAADMIAQQDLAQIISETAEGCDDMEQLASELGASSAGALNSVRVSDLAESLRPLGESLEIGQPSQPVNSEDGVRVIMICERDAAMDLPERVEIMETIGRERMDIMIRRYMRDLRLGAFLEVRV